MAVREADGSKAFPCALSIGRFVASGASRYEQWQGNTVSRMGVTVNLYRRRRQQGITNFLTLYGGTQFSDGYQAYQAGSAVSTPLGTVALDVTRL